MPVIPIPDIEITPATIGELADARYYSNGAIDMIGTELISGWDLVAQELWTMMISDEGSLGSAGELAIDIRQFTDYPPNRESAELIEEHINSKIYAHPLLVDLEILVEIVPLESDQMEIVFKKPADFTGLTNEMEDLEFKVKLNTQDGTVIGLLDDTDPRILFSTQPVPITEIKHMDETTSDFLLEYEPVEQMGISVYNLNDVQIVDGEIQSEELSASASIDILPGLVYPLYDHFNDEDLDGRVVIDHHLYDSGDNEIAQTLYSIVNNSLVPSYTAITPGIYRLDIITEKRYASVGEITRIKHDSHRIIYPFLRPYAYRVNVDRALIPGEYIVKYYIYSE